MGHGTANMVLGPFVETKGPRLPGRNPAIEKPSYFLLRSFRR
jgi:hypothetical protein